MMTPLDETAIPEAGEHYDLSAVVVPLLKGVIYQEERPAMWDALLVLQARVRDYVAVLGLELALDEAEGYAFLRSQPESDDPATPRVPRLVARHRLSFPVSLLLALLRKKMAEFDAGGGDTRLILSLDDVVELIRVFMPAGSNETRLMDQVETHLQSIEYVRIAAALCRRVDPGAG